MDRIEQSGRGAPSAQAAEVVPESLHRAVHAALEIIRSDGRGHILLPNLDDRRNSSTIDNLSKIARLADVEHNDRNIVVAAKSYGGGVHDLEVVAQDLAEGDSVVPR